MKMTKIKVFLISLIGTGVGLFTSSDDVYKYCITEGRCWDFWEISNLIVPFFVIFLPVLLFSAITYFLKEGVFKSWLKFTYWYFLIYVLVILLLSGMGGGGGYIVGDIFNSEFFAFNLSWLYIIISLILVVDKAISLRGPKK
jgi:hypothetical protein